MFSRRKSKVPKDKRPSDRGDIPKSKIRDKTIKVSLTPNNVKLPKDNISPKKTALKNYQTIVNQEFPSQDKRIPKSKLPKHEKIEVKALKKQKSVNKEEKQVLPTNNAQLKKRTSKNKKMNKYQSSKRPSLRKDKIQKIVDNKNKAFNKGKAKHPSKRDDISGMKFVRNKKQVKKVHTLKVKELPESRRVKVLEKKSKKVPKEKIPKDSSPSKLKIPKEKMPK